MLVFTFAAFIFSLTIEINQKEYTGESYESILELYQQDINTINSIIVKEGLFPVNSLSNQYTQLTTLIVPKDSFEGSINNEKFYNCGLLKTVSIDGATSLGRFAFEQCQNLESISIEGCTTIQYSAFLNCIKLSSINSPNIIEIEPRAFEKTGLIEVEFNSVTFLPGQTIAGAYYADQFRYCSSLQKVTMKNIANLPYRIFQYCNQLNHVDTPLVTSIGGSAFEGCNSLTTLTFPVLNSIDNYAFYKIAGLIEVDLPSINFIGSNSFEGCPNLKSFSSENCAYIDTYAFKDCIKLEKIYFPKLIEIKPYAFSNTGLIDVELNSVTSATESIIGGVNHGDQFRGCSNLQRITMKNLASISLRMFQDCNQLNYVDAPLVSSLGGGSFSGCSSFEEELIPANFLKEHKEIQEVTISCSVNVIDESAFEGCSKLKTLICPSVQELRSRCFYGPTLLESLSFESLNTLTGSHFFSNNANLQNLEFPNLESVSLSGYVSQDSPLLTSISLPETPPTINNGEFLIDSNPKLIGVSNSAAIQYDAADNVNNNMKFYSLCLSYVIMTCSIDGQMIGGLNLKSIAHDGAKIVEVFEGTITENDFSLPSSIISFSTREDVIINSIPSNSFSQNENLKTISILSKNDFKINEEAFSGCKSLESVNIKGASALKGLAFNECTQLKSVVLDDVKELIGNEQFNECFELSSISLKSLTTVDPNSNRIFFGCPKLSKLSLPSTPPTLFNKDTFSGLQDQLTLVLPSETDFTTYDNDVRIDGDTENDGLWCGISLPAAAIYIRFNNKNNIIKGLTISECISASDIEETLITSLEITKGILNFGSLRESFELIPNLATLVISRSVVYKDDLTSDIFSGCNLESITLPFIQIIPSECFKDCKQLKEIFINDATKICDSAFKGCTRLESISLNANTFEGDSHFEGCTSLTLISLTYLANADSRSTKIFSGCPLSHIYLPIIPPKTFNKDIFSGMNVLIHGLSNEQLKLYDENTDVEGDAENDYKWCGIDLVQLYISVSINEKESVNCPTLAKGVELNSVEEVTSIEIIQGMIMKSQLDELKNYPYLSTFVITENAVLESSVIFAEQFKDLTSITNIKIMKKVSLMNNCFSGCTSLSSIEFKEVDVICQECFSGCLNLITIKIPGCKELRGDQIFLNCQKLQEIDFLSLETVDNSASNLFEGCIELTKIKLPSKEPQTFHKNAFSSCSKVTLILPDKEDYFTYDDFSKVADDKKEDSKWCGINIESYLPKLITYKINGIEYTHRKLKKEIQDSLLLLSEGENKNVALDGTLELVDGLVDSYNLKSIVEGSSIRKLIAQLGTISDIESGTFVGCNSLEEIIIHGDIKIG